MAKKQAKKIELEYAIYQKNLLNGIILYLRGIQAQLYEDYRKAAKRVKRLEAKR